MVTGLKGATHEARSKETTLETLKREKIRTLPHAFTQTRWWQHIFSVIEDLLKKMKRPDRVGTRQAMDPNSMVTQ
jgi:hypothetical protein